MIPNKAAAAFVAASLSLFQAAKAAEWEYCVAPSEGQRRIYISSVFPKAASAAAETAFGETLDRERFTYDAVQCARADDEQSALAMRKHTVSVNRLWGRRIIELPWPPLQ